MLLLKDLRMLRSDLEKEKRAMQNIWKKREKQIDKVMTNTINMYSSVEGIAGSSVQPLQSLGFDEFLLDSED